MIRIRSEHHTARHLLFIYSVASDEMRAGGATVGWAEQQQVALHRVSTHGISTQYTLYRYTPHRQVWPELARQPGPRTALAPCNRLPWNRDSITTLLITLHFSSFLYTYITCF